MNIEDQYQIALALAGIGLVVVIAIYIRIKRAARHKRWASQDLHGSRFRNE